MSHHIVLIYVEIPVKNRPEGRFADLMAPDFSCCRCRAKAKRLPAKGMTLMGHIQA